MATTHPSRSRDEIARLGEELLTRQIRPKLAAADNGKFIAVDIDTGEYELDPDDYTAVMRLRSRLPTAEIWLARAGSPTTCRIGLCR